MFKAYRIESTIKPDKFQSLNNGIWYYNYDITERLVPGYISEYGDEEEKIMYSYIQVRISGEPTFSKCYEAILKAFKKDDGTSLYDIKTLSIEQNDLCDEIEYNVKVDFDLEEGAPIAKEKRKILKQIDEYDTSINVNSFFLNGNQVWLDKATRVGLMNSLSIEKEAGTEISTLWLGTMKIQVNTDAAIQMMRSLELYALQCFNKTAEHKAAVEVLTDIEEVKAYDYTEGYPAKLNFNIE